MTEESRKTQRSGASDKSGATNRPSKSSVSDGTNRSRTSQHTGPRRGDDHTQPRQIAAVEAAQAAISHLDGLIRRPIKGVVGVKPSGQGWHVVVEAMENERIPKTTELLAEYEVELDDTGGLISYRRTTRYLRGRRSTTEIIRPPGPR